MPSTRTYSQYNTRRTSQRMPVPGRADQVQNEAGGFAFPLDDWQRLQRFLILGSEDAYYVRSPELTRQNAEAVQRCLAENGVETVRHIVDVNTRYLAPSVEPQLFALALAASHPIGGGPGTRADQCTRQEALAAVSRVCRTGTHILHFVNYADGLRGWGRGLRRAVANWFLQDDVRTLAYEAIKYQQRDGWSLADLLRKSHPQTEDGARNAVLKWIVDSELPELSVGTVGEQLAPLYGYHHLRQADRTEAEDGNLIRRYRLPREAIPTEMLNSAEVWKALLDDMPIIAMLRNLATMSRVDGLFDTGEWSTDSPVVNEICAKLTDPSRLRRVHPLNVFIALKVYSGGISSHGSGRRVTSWRVNKQIVAALNQMFELSFGSVEQHDNPIHVAIDTSGSMSASVAGDGVGVIQAYEAAAAMAFALKKSYPSATFSHFNTAARPLGWHDEATVDNLATALRSAGGGTDCSAPIAALTQPVEAIVLLTDSQSWAGRTHVYQAMNDYRAKYNPTAKLIVCGTAATSTGLVDPRDGLGLECVGFSADLPRVITSFVNGDL